MFCINFVFMKQYLNFILEPIDCLCVYNISVYLFQWHSYLHMSGSTYVCTVHAYIHMYDMQVCINDGYVYSSQC